MNKLILAGGTGFLGQSLAYHFKSRFKEILIFSRMARSPHDNVRYLKWDAESFGDWTKEIDRSDVVINLCGKSVDCRYTKKNKALIFSSRLNSTSILGKAIQSSKQPPSVWINAASATIYRHSEDKQMSEAEGEIGEGFSVEVCKAWEKLFYETETPSTRKLNLRISLVMGNSGGVFPVLKKMTKRGMGGKLGSGKQFVSWIHIEDFCRLVEFLIDHKDANGPYNCTAPIPCTNADMMTSIRKELNLPFGLPAPSWLLEIGAFFIRTETELVLKSRNVIPDKAVKKGFKFLYPDITSCFQNLTR